MLFRFLLGSVRPRNVSIDNYGALQDSLVEVSSVSKRQGEQLAATASRLLSTTAVAPVIMSGSAPSEWDGAYRFVGESIRSEKPLAVTLKQHQKEDGSGDGGAFVSIHHTSDDAELAKNLLENLCSEE